MEQELKGKLVGLGLSEEQIGMLEKEGVIAGTDVAKLTANEVKGITGCGLVTAKKIEEAFAPVKETVETAIVRVGEAAVAKILPPLPEGDKSFIEMLMVPVVPKVEPIDVLAAVRAGIAALFHVERVPDVLLKKIEQYAENQEEPAKEAFYRIMDIIASRSNADILRICKVSGRFMSNDRKRAFLAKIDVNFWKGLADFQAQLEVWWDLWAGGIQSAGVALIALKDDKAGGDELYTELTEAPDSGTLRASADAVIKRINKLFAGAGIPVARTLAYEYSKTRELLDERDLPAALGFTTKDQLLKEVSQELGASVDADYVEFERNVAMFILGIMKLSEVPRGNEQERKYIVGMRKLGRLINWGKLGIRELGGPTPGSGTFRGGRG